MTDQESSAQILGELRGLLNGRRILVAEDNAQTRQFFGSTLTKLGAQVQVAEDGAQALELTAEVLRAGSPFELVMLDLMMPRMNGLTFLQKVREQPATANLPVVVMSAVGDARVIEECRRLGISGYLTKPSSLGLIRDALRPVFAAAPESAPAPAAEDDPAEDEFPTVSPLGYPFVYGGFPREKSYALRPACFRCPFDETTFTAPRLVDRALKPAAEDRYSLGLYTEGQEKEFLEYSLVEMISCPTCLYTSDRTGFHRPKRANLGDLEAMRQLPDADWEPVFFELNRRMQDLMLRQTPARQEVARHASDDGQGLFRLSEADPRLPRSFTDALIALNLAAVSAETMLGFYREETEARVRQKLAGFLLKLAHCYEVMAQIQRGGKGESVCREKRHRALREALRLLQSISDIEFRVLTERLYCFARRFHLADELFGLADTDEEREALRRYRKQVVGEGKQVLMQIRGDKDPAKAKERERNLNLIERFLEPLENRLYELEKAEKAQG